MSHLQYYVVLQKVMQEWITYSRFRLNRLIVDRSINSFILKITFFNLPIDIRNGKRPAASTCNDTYLHRVWGLCLHEIQDLIWSRWSFSRDSDFRRRVQQHFIWFRKIAIEAPIRCAWERTIWCGVIYFWKARRCSHNWNKFDSENKSRARNLR